MDIRGVQNRERGERVEGVVWGARGLEAQCRAEGGG